MSDFDDWLNSHKTNDDSAGEKRMTRGELMAQMLALTHHNMLGLCEIASSLDYIIDILLADKDEEQLARVRAMMQHRQEHKTLRNIENDLKEDK